MYSPFKYNFERSDYKNYLEIFSKLSGLYSESNTPFINYRIAENIFCKAYNAINLSRSDTAFDAKIKIKNISYGVGLKTFIANSDKSLQKVAEFNSMSYVLKQFSNLDLVKKLSEFRNERINLAKRVYDIEECFYHIVARRENEILLFDTSYDLVNLDKINILSNSNSSIIFTDNINEYNFNYSKSTLLKKFNIPDNAYKFNVEILDDPFELLKELFNNLNLKSLERSKKLGVDYVYLPLYGRGRIVHPKSKLNQWNAGGRVRDINEVYIPVPIEFHKKYPNFFPDRDIYFDLTTPTNETFKAKLCQDNKKALMTNPNKALSDWLLRKTLKLDEGQLLTIEYLDKLGFDSVRIDKNGDRNYSIDISKTNSFEEFIKD